MKKLLILLAVLVVGTVSAQDAQEPQDPKALVKAREAYQNDVKQALAPINRDYLAKLDALKKDLGTNGDTAGMVAVQKEIDAVKATLSPTENQAALAKTAILGRWGWDGKNTINITKDGKFTHPYWGKGTWEYNEQENAYHLFWSNGANDALTLSKDGKTLLRPDGRVAGTRK